jgi:TPR repeat protein
MKQGSAVFLGLMLASAAPVYSQTQTPAAPPAAPQVRDTDTIIVNGKRMPTAEAPQSATCEALVRTDPSFRAMIEAREATGTLGPFVYLPTRMPRNPDYSAPPLSPPGSPLPEFGRARFGVGARDSADHGNNAGDTNASDIFPDTPNQTAFAGTAQEDLDVEFSDREAAAACRGAYVAGNDSNFSGADYSGPNAAMARFDRGQSEIARNDRTLPTAFYLFDQRRFAESLPWFKKAAHKLPENQGGDEAQLFVGKLYLMGLGNQSNPQEGVKWLEKVAMSRFNPVRQTPVFDPKQPEMNTAMGEAAVILGNVYRTGFKGVRKDPAESLRWYQRALAVGHIAAAKTIGDMYYHGVGTRQDSRKAADYYLKAAQFGLPTAEFALAEIYYSSGTPRDLKRALAWYQAAAKSEHPGALYALARAYDLGEAVPADPQKALGFYKLAALQGHSAAQAAMGGYFYEGKFLPKDLTIARKWFEQAARDSDADGTFNLAAMMARGEGGPKDVVHAWALMKRAAALGSQPAPTALAALERQMSPAERAAAAGAVR